VKEIVRHRSCILPGTAPDFYMEKGWFIKKLN
jgi:hypothetical protein